MAEINKIQQTEDLVDKKKADAEQVYNQAADVSGDSWADELMSDDIRKQPQAKSVTPTAPKGSGDDWADAMMSDDVRKAQQPAPQQAVEQNVQPAAVQQTPSVDNNLYKGEDLGEITVTLDKGSNKQTTSVAEPVPQEQPSKPLYDYTKAPTFNPVTATWGFTKTIETIDKKNPLYQAALNATKMGTTVDKSEISAILNNKNWDDLRRQADDLMSRYRNGFTPTPQSEHDAIILGWLHNQMVALENNFSDVYEMDRNPGEKYRRLVGGELKKRNKYYSQYEDFFLKGADLDAWNPFLDLPESVEKAREQDKAAGKERPDNYYFHMAVKDPDFKDRLQAWGVFYAARTGKRVEEAYDYAARIADRRKEGYKEERAKEFAKSSWYVPVSALLDNSVAQAVMSVGNAYDVIKGQPLRSESVNDLLQRSMKYAGEGKNVARGVFSFIPEAVSIMPVTGVGATRAVGALSKVFEFTPRAMKIATGGLSFMGFEMAKSALGSWSQGHEINWAEMAGNSAKGFLLGAGGSLISEGVAGIAPRVNSTAANYAIQGAGKVAETGLFASTEMAMAYLGNDKEATWTSSLLNNGALIISMAIGHGIGNGFGFKSRISSGTIEKVRKAGYNTLADEMARHTQAVERGATPKGYSEAAIEELQSLQQSMGGNGLSWSDYAEVLKPTNSIMTKPGTNSLEKVEDGKGFRIVSYDVNGVEIEHSKVYDKTSFDKEFAKRQRDVEKKKETANVEAFDLMRDSTIKAKAARSVADRINADDGKSVYNEDGTVNEAFDGVTADDILYAYETLSERPSEELSADEARLISMFDEAARGYGDELPDSNAVKKIICERYGVKEDAFDAAWKEDASKRKSKEAEACAAYNSAMARPYEVALDGQIGTVDGRQVSIKNAVKTDAEGMPLDPNQTVYYDDGAGVKVTTAEHVLMEPTAEDPGVLGDRIANENLRKALEAKKEEMKSLFAEIPTDVLESNLDMARTAIENGEDLDGTLRLSSLALEEEIERRRASGIEESVAPTAEESAPIEIDAEGNVVEGTPASQEETDVSADTQEQIGRLVIDESKYDERDVLSKEDIQATADFLNGEIDEREYAHRIGWDDEYLSQFPEEEWKNNARLLAEGRREYLKVEEPKEETVAPIEVNEQGEVVETEPAEAPKPENKIKPVEVDNATTERDRKINELLDFMGYQGKERNDARESYLSSPEALEEDYNDYLAETQKEAPQKQEPVAEVVPAPKEEPAVDNSQQEQKVVDSTDEPMPMLEDGEPNVDLATPKRTRHYLYEESGLEAQDATDKVDYEIKKAKDAVKKAEKGQPKMGDKGIDGNIGKFKKAQQEWNDRKSAADAKLEYWNEVKRQQGLYDLIAEIGEAKSPKSMAELVVKLKGRFKNDREMLNALNANAVEPKSLHEACMLYLSSGARFLWDGEGAKKGLKQELGWGEGERKKMYGMLSKDGTTIQGAVHDIVDQYGADLGIDLSRSQDVYNALIEALGSVSTRGDVFAFINSRRLQAVEDILRKRLGNGEARSREDAEADARADEEYNAFVEEYRDELPENFTQDDVFRLMEQKRQEQENPPVEEQQQTTEPSGEEITDDYFNQREGEDVPFSLKQEQTESKETVTSDVRTRLEEKLGKDATDRIENIAKSLGVRVRFTDKDVNGFMDHDEGILYIGKNIDSNKTEAFVAGHELTHEMQALSEGKGSDVYSIFKQAALDWAREHREEGGKGYDFDWIKGKYEEFFRDKYKNEALDRGMSEAEAEAYAEQRAREKVTDDYVNDEIAANVAGRMLDNPAVAEEMFKLREAETPQERRTRLQRILDWIKEYISKRIGNKQPEELTSEEQKLLELRDKFNDMYNEVVREDLDNQGVETSENGDARRYSVRFLTDEEQREDIIRGLMEHTGRSREDVEKWLDSETSLASMILSDPETLDYTPDPRDPAIKKNSDYPQGTVDFSNICRKRKDFTNVYTILQKENPNRVFTALDLEEIRQAMKEDGYTVACGLCFVEDRRQLLGEIAEDFINRLQNNDLKPASQKKIGDDTYVPTIAELITPEGSKKLAEEHPTVWEAFRAHNNARGQQAGRLYEGYNEYKREILDWSDAKVKKVNDVGGLRIFSFSDFEAPQLLDIIQIIQDCGARGVKIQGYTKVPEFAKAVKDTGIKLNQSLIPKGDGVKVVDGKEVLDFDPVEGIDVNDKNFVNDPDNPNVGTILVGINDKQIRLAMQDPFVDYIIPFHSGLRAEVRQKKGIGDWVNYKMQQREYDPNTGKAAEEVNIYTDVLQAAEAEGNPITNKKEFVEKFLKVCEERGVKPRFWNFLDTDANGNYIYTEGYHKFLVDFKLFDKEGNIIPQEVVKPEFDDAFNKEILDKYAEDSKVDADYSDVLGKIRGRLGIEERRKTRAEEMAEQYSLKEDERRPTFYSNAARAVENIKQNKATAEQWLAMIKKNGGLKSGEDKWMGLSQWLEDNKGKSLTKDEVMQFVKGNGIQMEETHYKEGLSESQQAELDKLQQEFDEIANTPEEVYKQASKRFADYVGEMEKKYGEDYLDKMTYSEKRIYSRFAREQEEADPVSNDVNEIALREMISRYGDDFDLAFTVVDGKLIPQVDPFDEEDFSGYTNYFLGEGDNTINSTRLSYTTGGLENNREIAFVIPDVEPYQESDTIHFGPENQGKAVMWVRFGETTDADGKRVLVIDEIQSNRHQDAREKGYKDDNLSREYSNLEKKRDEALRNLIDYEKELASKYGAGEVHRGIGLDLNQRDYVEQMCTEEEFEKLKALTEGRANAEGKVLDFDKAHGLQMRRGVPEAPFEKNWHEVAMKRMLRLAAEEGFDKVAWTTGEQQTQRYGLGKLFNTIERDDYSLSQDKRFVLSGDNYESFVVGNDGVIKESSISEAEGRPLTEVVGKDLAQRMMNLENGETLEGEQLNIGGEGMKGFYDNILPRFMDKYGKRWGVKTGTVELPNVEEAGRVMHSVDVTPEMKESVMQGQPLFRTSKELDKDYPTWLSGQTTDSGQHTTQITSTVKSYNRIGDWMKKNGMEGASVLDASSGLGVGTQALRDMGFNVDDVEPYPSKDREAPTYLKYEDIDKQYDVVISNAVLNVIPDDWRADVLKSMADKLKVGGKLIINVRDARSIEGQKQKIELDSPSEILVTDSKGNIRAYQKGFTKKELQDWVKSELGDGWSVEVANENNSGLKSGVAVVVTKGEGAAPIRYRNFEPIGERGVKKVTVVSEPEYVESKNYFGEPFTYRKSAGEYQVEGMGETFNGIEAAVDAVRKRNPDYCVYLDDEGNIQLEAWSNLLPDGIKPNTYAKVIAMSGGKMSSAMKKRIAKYTEREMQQARTRAEELTKELGLDVEFHDDPNEFEGRKAKAKGWYDPKTGKIHIVMGNHSGVGDVMATMLHEGVAHHGLRKLFGDDFNTFLDNVADNVGEEIYKDIALRASDLASKDNNRHSLDWYRRAATEEYIAELAEDGLYNAEKNGSYAMRAWEWIKESFLNMLRKAGFHMELTDDELRYVLWSSHNNLRRGAEAMAKDAVMREKAGIKEYVEDGEKIGAAAERGEQLSLFGEKEPPASLGRAKEMSDRALLKEIGKDRYDVESLYADEYDRRHQKEYYEEWDNTTKMLEDSNTTINQAGDMLIDAAYDLRNKYTGRERTAAKARYEAIQDYYLNKEVAIDKARNDFFTEHEDELKERFGDNYFEDESIDKLMSEYGMAAGEPRVPYSATTEARKILRGDDTRYREGEEDNAPSNDLASRMRERMRQRMERARAAQGGGEPPVEPPTPPAAPTPEPEPQLPPTAFDRPMTPIEIAKEAAIKAVADTKASLERRNEARRELDASLKNIHKAMRLQKEYDRATVENVVALAKMMVKSGLIDRSYISNLTPLFTKLKDVTGKENITSTVNDIMDVMLKSQERSIRNEIAKLMKITGTKVDENGVVKQAGLDIRGQHTMSEFKEYMDKGSQIIDRRIERLEEMRERVGEDDTERLDEIDDKILGCQLAKQYSEIEETNSVNISEAEEDLNYLKERYKAGEIGVKEYTEQKHSLENLIRSYRMAQADALWNQINAINWVITDSKAESRNWVARQKERQNEIRHDAYRDMQGTPSYTQGDNTKMQEIANSALPKFFSSSLFTLQTMLKSLGNKHALGEGYLYNRFFRGWMENRDAEITEYRDDMKTLNAKAKELTGKTYFGIYNMIKDLPTMNVEYYDGGEMRPHELDQGQLGYAYMVNKMEDGAAALRNMGITEEKMQEIAAFLNPKLKQFYDWLQDDFLAGKWDGMNEVHKRLFGADMDRVENYIPLRRDKEAGKQKVDISQENEQQLQSTVVGSIIKRIHSNLGIDLKHNNAIDVVANHLLEATHWKHFSEWKRDSNSLLSDTKFRNKVKNSTTIYGSGDILWERLNQVFKIAGGDYKPSAKSSSIDKAIVDMARTVNTAKVSMRVFTATKQLLSLPVFATECNTATLLKNVGFLLSPDKISGSPTQNSFVWCMENLPQFRERWVSRIAGETRLENGDLGWGYSRQKVLEAAGRIGLTPNAFIDACTVAAGAKSIYEKRYKQYRKDGFDEYKADKKAKIDAETAFNESQQSSEKAFVSPLQVDRTAVALGLSTFRNASMGYERKFVDAIRNFKHLTMGGKEYKEILVKRKEKELIAQGMGKAEARAAAEKEYKNMLGAKAYREVTMEFMKKQMVNDGLTETQAKDAAERLYRRALWRSTLNFLMFGFGAQMAWNVGGKLPYLIFGDDDEEKKEIVEQAAVHAGIGGWVEGLPAGDMLSEGMTNWAMNLIESGNPLDGKSFFEFDPDLLTVTSDAVKVTKYLEGKNPLKGATAFVNLLGQIYTGVNPETFTDAGVAIYDACGGDPKVGNEALMCILRIMQCPQSQLDQMYIDELKMSAREAQKLSPEDVARRYAYYKAYKDTPYMWWMYNQGKKDEIVKKYEGDFTKKLNEDVKEAGGLPEDYFDLMGSATTKKRHDDLKNKGIDALAEQGPEALMNAYEKERAKGAAADYNVMNSIMSRYQKIVYGEEKMPDPSEVAYEAKHDVDLGKQAEKIGRDLGFGAQDSYFQMSKYKTDHSSKKDPVMKEFNGNDGGFKYSKKGKFFNMEDYTYKVPVKDVAKREKVLKVMKDHKEELRRSYRNGWRIQRIKALYEDIEAESLKANRDSKAMQKNFEEILHILDDERKDAEQWEKKTKK